jgi:hypothetical protein
METTLSPAAMHKVHNGLGYTITLKPDDSSVYLDIDKLGLLHHQVHTSCEKNDWEHLEAEGDHAAFTIIDLHNAASKVFL